MRFGMVLLAACLGVAGALGSAPALAATQDEIQVYTDDINKPGEFGLELHVNTTPKGRSAPDFPGEVTPHHGLRFTPEFSYGLSRDFEAGLYLPYVRDAQGTTLFSGPKLRLKWLPLRPEENAQGWFLGANLEYARVAPTLEQSRFSIELRPILGYRGRDWLFAANPILGWDLTGPGHDGKADFSPSVKVARNVAAGVALGVEYYAEMGKTNRILSHVEQAHTIYFALDFDRKPWVFNLGIGRGLTDAADRWTLKAIFEIPFN
jgi:hypothetical protein